MEKTMNGQSRTARPRRVYLFLLVAILGTAIIATPQLSKMVAASQSPVAPSGQYFDHVVVIMMEDHGMQDICAGNPPPCSASNGAAYMAGLANSNAIGSQYLGVSHFSQADYLAMIGGDTFGCGNNGCPPVSNPNLIDRLESAGLTWKGYMEDQNVAAGCDNTYHEPYTLEHNPFDGFSDILNNPSRCAQIVLANPSSCTVTDCALVNDLNSASPPNYMWLTPNNCNNMHGFTGVCAESIPTGDNYLHSLVPNILNSNAFTAQRSLLFVVFDEGNGYCPLNGSSEDCVYAVMAGPEAKTSFVSSNLYNHYSFLKTVEVNWNLASLTSNDANASPMTEFLTTTPPVLLSTSFTYSPSSPSTGQYVWFTASGSGGTQPYNFTWTFGDGTTGSGAKVYHAYSTAGSYSATLTTTDSSPVQQTATSSQTLTVTSTTPPANLTASFTVSIGNPSTGETVSFKGTATGGTAPYTYSWNFGDSATTIGNPVSHTYATAGTYQATLTVSDSAGHVASASQTITVSAPLTARFTYSPSSPSVLTSIQFTATASGGAQPYSYSWDYGDGSTDSGASVSHSYLLPGTYTVTLTVTDSSGQTATSSQQVTATAFGL